MKILVYYYKELAKRFKMNLENKKENFSLVDKGAIATGRGRGINRPGKGRGINRAGEGIVRAGYGNKKMDF